MTARGLSTSLTVITGHDPLSEQALAGMALLGGTTVVLMGRGTLGHTAAGLIRHGMAPDTPVGLVERGCTPAQRVCIAPLDGILLASAVAGIASPCVLVIGEVGRLARARTSTCATWCATHERPAPEQVLDERGHRVRHIGAQEHHGAGLVQIRQGKGRPRSSPRTSVAALAAEALRSWPTGSSARTVSRNTTGIIR